MLSVRVREAKASLIEPDGGGGGGCAVGTAPGPFLLLISIGMRQDAGRAKFGGGGWALMGVGVVVGAAWGQEVSRLRPRSRILVVDFRGPDRGAAWS
jgi:hypothetical protein